MAEEEVTCNICPSCGAIFPADEPIEVCPPCRCEPPFGQAVFTVNQINRDPMVRGKLWTKRPVRFNQDSTS